MSTTRKPAWLAQLARYETPSARTAAFQLLTTVVPYLALLALMFLGLHWGWSYALVLPLALPAGALLVRTFIFFHDCCHGSFVRSPVALRIIGGVLGVITFTPFSEWRYSHGVHHVTAGNLDRRGVGDVWTMTVEEFTACSPARRALYRFYRNPIVMFGVGSILSFVITNRIPARGAPRARILSVLFTNAALAAIVTGIGLTAGLGAYALVQAPVLLIGGAMGVWLFYVQHQFEPSWWARSGDWSALDAALRGSSWYRLPRLLQWISGSIGLHHLHHLRPRVPNYNLQRCVDEVPELRTVHALTLRESLRSVRFKLWDEKARALVGFPRRAGAKATRA